MHPFLTLGLDGGKRSALCPVPTNYGSERAQKPNRALWRKEYLAPPENRTPDRSTRSLVAIPTELSRLHSTALRFRISTAKLT